MKKGTASNKNQINKVIQLMETDLSFNTICFFINLSRYEITQICEIYQLKEIPITASNKYKTF